MRKTFFFTVIIALALLQAATSAFAVQRDHLTPMEVDRVKEAQVLDKRIEVFIKAVERRMLVLNGGGAAPTNPKQAKKDAKDAELWGDLPTGSRTELIGDIARIFDEAITNIDDVSSRDDRNPLIPKALRRLAQAVDKVMVQMEPLKTQAKTEAEIANLEMLFEDAQQIREAANRLPPEVEKKGKKKEKKEDGGA